MTKFYLTLCPPAVRPSSSGERLAVPTNVVTDVTANRCSRRGGPQNKTTATTTGARGEYAAGRGPAQGRSHSSPTSGMKKLEVPVAGRTKNRRHGSKEMNTSINEVVVIGYGTVRRADLTETVRRFRPGHRPHSVNNIAEAISAGKLAGVRVLSPPTGPRRRGVDVCPRATPSPEQFAALHRVDGFPVSSISDISPSDIRSIDVLKDASS